MAQIKIGILTVSDRASAGIYEDLSGKALEETLRSYIKSEWIPVYKVIPDEQLLIEQTLINLADEKNCFVLVTKGSTSHGFARRNA